MDRQTSAEETFQMMQCGNIDLNFPIEYGILLLGKTKVGKTTTSHYLTHQYLQGGYNDQKSVVYKLINGDPRYQTARIGDLESVSETQIPNFFNFQDSTNKGVKSFLIDCPGYLDTYGCFRILSNRFFHYQVFSKVENIKFIITFPYRYLLGPATETKQTFNEFLKGFINHDLIKQNLIKATCIVVTGVPHDQDEQSVRQRYRGTPQNVDSNCRELYSALKKDILENNRLFIFKSAILGRGCNTQNTLLQNICASTTYWKRDKKDNGQVDMSNIKISITDYIEKDMNQFDKQLKELDKFFKGNQQQSLKDLAQILKLLINDNQIPLNQKNQDTFQFLNQAIAIVNKKKAWRQTQSKCYGLYKKYAAKRDKLKSQLFKSQSIFDSQSVQVPFWLHKIKSLKLTQQLCQPIASENLIQRQVSAAEEQSKIIKKILQILIMLAKSKRDTSVVKDKEKNQLMLEFAYDIYKDIEISNKLFKLIKETTKQNKKEQLGKHVANGMYFILVQYPSNLRNLFLKPFAKSSKQIMIENINSKYFGVLSKNVTTKGFSQIAKYLEQFKKQVKSSKEIPQSSLVSLLNKIDSKIAQFNSNSLQAIKKQPNPVLSSLKQMQQKRKQIYQRIKQCKGFAIDNQRLKVENNRIVLLMAQCLVRNEQLDLAMSLYECSFDAHKIFQIMDKKQEKYKRLGGKEQDIVLHLMDYMRKAKKYHRKQLAIKKAQQALHYALDIGDIYKLNQITAFIKQLVQNRPYENDNYLQQFLEKEIQQVYIPPQLSQSILKLVPEERTPNGFGPGSGGKGKK